MKNNAFKSGVAVLTALVTVLGASAACLASVAVSNAGDADFAGLDASIRAQKAEIINEIEAYEHYRAYADYARYEEYGYQLYDPNADEETAVANGIVQREAWGVASGISTLFFSPRYVNAEGGYDLERELQEEWADDLQNGDLEPAPHFEESDHLRRRSSFLTADMIVFAVAFWFLTAAQVTDKWIKYVWAALGVLALLAGVLGILIGRYLI